jgi:hypothetical protein
MIIWVNVADGYVSQSRLLFLVWLFQVYSLVDVTALETTVTVLPVEWPTHEYISL